MDAAPGSQAGGGRSVITLSSGLIRWSSPVKGHSASIIRISLTRPSRFHMVNTRWALSQLWVRAIAERPFVFFVLSWAAEGEGGGGLWDGCTSLEAVYTSRGAKQKKMHDFLRGRRLMPRLHLISERLERPRWQIVEFLSLWFLYTVWAQMIYHLRLVWLQETMQDEAFIYSRRIKQYFTRNNVVLGDSLHLWALSGQCMVICSVIKRAPFRGS